MSEGPPVYRPRQPQTMIIMGRAPELWTTPAPDDEPIPARLPELTPEAINRLLDLLEQLPPGLATFSRETHRFQLVCTLEENHQTWWLDIGTMLHRVYQENGKTYANTLDRLQMLLDLAVAAKAAEPWLRQLAGALT